MTPGGFRGRDQARFRRLARERSAAFRRMERAATKKVAVTEDAPVAAPEKNKPQIGSVTGQAEL